MIGPVAFGQNGYRTPDGRPLWPGEGPQLSAGTAQAIDEEIKGLVDQARERAMAILKGDRELLDHLSEVLIAREVIEGDDLKRFVDGDEPIPTEEELDREIRRKRESNGQNGSKGPGPSIIGSIPAPTGSAWPVDEPRIPVSDDIPPRPD